MSKHTPGPWRIAENEWNTRTIPWTDAIQIEGDVDAGWSVPPLVCVTYRGDSSDANARLIAAAPDMLEALKEIVDANNLNHDRPWSQIIDAARAAIAKATGEES